MLPPTAKLWRTMVSIQSTADPDRSPSGGRAGGTGTDGGASGGAGGGAATGTGETAQRSSGPAAESGSIGGGGGAPLQLRRAHVAWPLNRILFYPIPFYSILLSGDSTTEKPKHCKKDVSLTGGHAAPVSMQFHPVQYESH